ncbi:MAG: ABC transporter permease [Oscillospiraceae bacterium]
MKNFSPLFKLGIKRRSKDFFIIFYSVVFPIVIIALLGYLTSKSYGLDFTSYEYYSIVMIPFCLLMGITSVAYAAVDEKRVKTSYRYMIAPISKSSLIISKFLSCVIVLTVCSMIVLLISRLMFHLPVNENAIYLIILLLCESIAISGLGLFFGLASKKFATIQNFLNLPIMIFGFLGGAFFPVSSLNPILSIIVNLSPLTWINRGIMYCLYVSDATILLYTSAILFIIGILFTMLTIKYFKKEAFA